MAVVNRAEFAGSSEYLLQCGEAKCRLLLKRACALRYGNLDRFRTSAVSRGSGDTMKQISDIRLGGTLLSVATLICGGFAIAALIPLIHWNPGEPVSNAPTSAATQPLLHKEQHRFHEFQTAPTDSRQRQEPGESASHDIALEEGNSVSQVVSRGSTGGDPGFEQTTSQRGVYVPVTVHPVTVNVDGSALAEQLSVLAEGIDEMVAAQRQTYQVATVPPSAGGTTGSRTGPHDERLSQIDASVRELLSKVETLRAESRTADSRLTEEVRQAKMASDLMQEFRLALAEHRQFLADSPRSFSPSAARIAQHAEPSPDALSDEHEELLIPEPVDLEPEPPLWDALEDIEKPDDPDVPLPFNADKRTSSIALPPTSVQIVLPTAGQSPSEATESTPDAVDSFGTTVFTDGASDRTEESELAFAMFAPPETVVVEPDPGAEHSAPIPLRIPTENIQSIGNVPAGVRPSSAADAIRAAKPVIFEQTFSFVLPPATNPLANLQTTGVDNAGRTNYARSAGFQELPAPSYAALPGPGSRVVAKASVNSEATPSTIAGNRNGMKRRTQVFVEPTRANVASKNGQPSPPRIGRHSGRVTSVPHPEAHAHGHVYEATGSRRHRHGSAAAQATKRPSVLHRLASSIRRVGRPRTVD